MGALKYVGAFDLFPEILIVLFLLFEWEVTNMPLK